MPTACILIIGNEILSGRTQDTNIAFIARGLAERGISLREARVVADEQAAIVEAVNACRARYTYVFTTGGIGPTHDDITSAAVARAFGRNLVRNAGAEAILRAHYPAEKLNAARLKMADMPEGAALIENPVSAAPGFIVENVYVMAGVPSILQAMFASLAPALKAGPRMFSCTLTACAVEGDVAGPLEHIQRRYPQVEIGSYPFMRASALGTSIVLRSTDQAALAQTAAEVRALLAQFAPVTEGE